MTLALEEARAALVAKRADIDLDIAAVDRVIAMFPPLATPQKCRHCGCGPAHPKGDGLCFTCVMKAQAPGLAALEASLPPATPNVAAPAPMPAFGSDAGTPAAAQSQMPAKAPPKLANASAAAPPKTTRERLEQSAHPKGRRLVNTLDGVRTARAETAVRFRASEDERTHEQLITELMADGIQRTVGNIAEAINRPFPSVCTRLNDMMHAGTLVRVMRGVYKRP